MTRLILPFSLLLSACAAFPSLDDRITAEAAKADFPTLVPIGPVLAAADARQGHAPDTATMDARIAGLNARAEALRGRVIEPATQDRLRAGITTAPLR